MNAYKYYGRCGYLVSRAIVKKLDIPYSDIYKTLEDIEAKDGVVITKEGKRYELKLVEV